MRHSTRSSCIAILLVASCASCSSDDDSKSPDSGQPDAGLPSELTESERAWSSLVEENGDTYWYRTTSCGQGYRSITWVQVTDGEVSLVARETEQPASCDDGEPYVYEDFVGRTLDALYEECGQQARRLPFDDLNFEVDGDGVISACWSTAPNCADACDEGFFIRELAFGTRAFPDASVG